jgi:lipid-A-disaccharide synthase
MDKGVVKELIQNDLTPGNLCAELSDLLGNETRRKQLETYYKKLKKILTEGENASTKAAMAIVHQLTGAT